MSRHWGNTVAAALLIAGVMVIGGGWVSWVMRLTGLPLHLARLLPEAHFAVGLQQTIIIHSFLALPLSLVGVLVAARLIERRVFLPAVAGVLLAPLLGGLKLTGLRFMPWLWHMPWKRLAEPQVFIPRLIIMAVIIYFAYRLERREMADAACSPSQPET